MKVKWLGHASFLITSDSGMKIITDPYPSGIKARFLGMMYPKIHESADVVTVSHNHPDHNNVHEVSGEPKVIRHDGVTEVDGITFRGVNGSHGALRGANVMYCFTVDGVRCCHLGDIVERLSDEQLRQIGEVDVLFLPLIRLPFIRKLNIRPARPKAVIRGIQPKVIIPMHYRNRKCWMPFPTIDRYLKYKTRYKKLDTSEFELSKESLPSETEIVVLKSA